MNYKLVYEGAPGEVEASLMCNGTSVARVTGLEDRKAAEKWAGRAARDHKVDNTPAATAQHDIVLSGSKTFTL